MKKIVIFIISALFCTTGNFTTAQSLSEKVIKNYPTSVVLRVYDAMLVRTFDEAQQIKLADEYRKQEPSIRTPHSKKRLDTTNSPMVGPKSKKDLSRFDTRRVSPRDVGKNEPHQTG